MQLFVEFDESLKTPTVEILLQRMFTEQQISFANVGVSSDIHVHCDSPSVVLYSGSL